MATSYPTGLDAFTAVSPSDATSTAVGSRTHAQLHNDTGDAVEAIEAELGLDPAGASATVAARLSALDITVAAKAGLVGNTFAGRQVVTAGQSLNLQAKTGTYAITTADAVVTCSGTFTVTLPDATTCTGQAFTIRNIATTTITVARTSAQTIDAAAANVSIAGKGTFEVVSDGAGWLVTNGHYTDETVGRRIFTWSPALQGWQMTYGDTGWRDCTALFSNVNATVNQVMLRRVNQQIDFLVDITENTGVGTLDLGVIPVGFTTVSALGDTLIADANGTATALLITRAGVNLMIYRSPAPSNGTRFRSGKSMATSSAWPASLPGTASGTIPSA